VLLVDVEAACGAERGCREPTPILLRVDTAVAHGTANPIAKAIAEATDSLAFLEIALAAAPSPDRQLQRQTSLNTSVRSVSQVPAALT
jgi:hypothetical protein